MDGSIPVIEDVEATRSFAGAIFMRIAVAAVVICFVRPTHASTFAAGLAAPPGSSLALGDTALLAPSVDTIRFQPGASGVFESSSFVTTAATFDVNGANFSGGPLLDVGSVRKHHAHEGLPPRDHPLALGDAPTFFDPSLPIASSHAASIDIAATSPVSEPNGSTLLLTGAVLLAWNLYGRRMKKRG